MLYGPIYPLSAKELRVLREYIETSLYKEQIQRSESPTGAPILFIPKKDSSLRLYIDYYTLNTITRKDRTLLPLISETLDRLIGAKYFIKLDLKDTYYYIRIRAGDKQKTTFRTRYSYFKYYVIPFRLINTPTTF